MNEKFKLHDKLLAITTSIDVAFYRGEDISEVEFIKHADDALYIAKESGKNTYHIYNP